jgi:sigma-E factor negative regulatory protein RseA
MTTMSNETLSANLSALYDGQLGAHLSATQARQAALALVRQSLADDGQTLQAWRSYSLASDALNGSQAGSAAHREVLTPAQPTAPNPQAPQAPQERRVFAVQNASNDNVFRWKLAAGVAAFAATGSLVWNVLGAGAGDADTAVAQNKLAPTTSTATSQEPVMLRDARLDALMAAHRQFGGVSALQQGAGALHSVSLVSVRP